MIRFNLGIWLAVASLWLQPYDDAYGGNATADRRQRVEQMPAVEKEALGRQRKRFSQLPRGERQRLRRLHASLEASPRAEQLRQAMLRYHEWLKALPSGQRAEILALPIPARLEVIRQIIQRQERERFNTLVARRLRPADHAAILAWLDDLVARHESQLAAMLPTNLRKRLARMNAAERRRTLMFHARRRSGGGRSPIDLIELDDEDVNRLGQRLSADVRTRLQRVQDEPQRRELLRRWVAAAMFSRRLPQVNQRDLRAFYESLPPESKEYLENLPHDRRRGELRQLFMKQRFDERRRPLRRRGVNNDQ